MTTRKVIINSHVEYSKPLRFLLSSVLDSDFLEWYSLLDIIVVVGGDASYPQGGEVGEEWVEELGGKCVFVRAPQDSHDFHGLNCLHTHFSHPLVEADTFFYVLDTSVFQTDFGSKLSSLDVGETGILTCPLPNSSLLLFGKGVVKAYGERFGANMTKQEALRLELEGQFLSFGDVTFLEQRVLTRKVDIYGTGHPRHEFHYPSFGVKKYVLWGKNGDMTGNVVLN